MLYIIKNVDLSLVFFHLKNSKTQYLVIAFLLGALQILVATIRFYLFLRAADSKYEFKDCFKAVITAIAYNSFLPSKGGDLIKGFILSKKTQERIIITGITLLERLADLLIIFLISLVGTFFLQKYNFLLINLTILSIIIIFYLSNGSVFNIPVIGKFLRPFKHTLKAILYNWEFTLLSLFTCLIFWSINIIIIYLLLKSVGVSLLYCEILVYWPYSIVVGILPLSISGFGTRDSAFVKLINHHELNESILASSFLYTVNVYWFISLISVVIILLFKFKK